LVHAVLPFTQTPSDDFNLTNTAPPPGLDTFTYDACFWVHTTPSSVTMSWINWNVSFKSHGCWGTASPFVDASETFEPKVAPDELANWYDVALDQRHVGKYPLVSTNRTVEPPGRVLVVDVAVKCCALHVGTVVADAADAPNETENSEIDPRRMVATATRLATRDTFILP